MANVIQTATNRFSKGLVLDLSPETTSNEVLTNALNATFLTFNGNELSLQNDMGNARVETAYLPEGYIPVGTCEYGGIIYIVSYNPLEDKSLIGCFPSPERNVSNEELGIENVSLENENFVKDGNIINTSNCVILKNNALNPGDKFIITATPEIFESDLKDLVKNGSLIKNPVIALNIVSIEDSGKITYLNSDVRYYDVTYPEDSNNSYKYYILGSKSEGELPNKQDIDDYRNVLSSGYSIFKSKISGKLAILAELITIDSYSVTHSIEPLLNGSFQIILHPEISPELTSSNYTTTPKLKYYYLQNSLGFISTFDNNGKSNNIPLFKDNDFNTEFGKVSFKNIYNDVYNIFKEDEKLDINLFAFPKPHTYHINAEGNFLAGNKDTDLSYNDISLAYLTIPKKLIDNGIDLPFKYDYTITPCMRFGKLTNLSVSNTIDFSNLHAFNKSQFTTWKYRIDGNQLKLTFGAEVFDTFETYKVDALVLEFYDLWGFAGSLEITNKKSYNGVFTKIISLNSKDALSNKKIKDNTYTTDYKHNINITEEDRIRLDGELEKVYKYNNVELTHNADTGWDGINEADNDCGILYSNILYGVKSYLRVDKNGTKEFIPKREMFLYTLPLYNEYYNKVNDFNNLEYPELEFNLTYRLEDYGNKMYYHDNDNFIQGYFKDDNVIINQYLSGNYNESSSIHTTRYYKYYGTSKLYIELGLNKNYEALNVSYDPIINEYFNCELCLLGDDGVNNYSIYSNSDSIPNNQTALNYLPGYSYENTLTINGSNGPINLKNIRQYNFITNPTNKNINIDYSFIVGYNVTISDIAKTTIPATTICALYHKADDGTYNLGDFSLYELENNYLSTCVFFNSGDHQTEQLSHGRQITTNPGSIVDQCKITQSNTNTAKNITTSGKLNTTIVNEFMSHIGKLSIGQPHTHVIDTELGANISVWTDPNGTEFKYWGLFNNVSLGKLGNAGKDKTYGIAPANESERKLNEGTYQISNLYKYPKYNLCVNTKNFINYNHEFISTLDYATTDYGMQRGHDFYGKDSDRYDPTSMRLYTGFSSKEISIFNRKLLNTMSKIYAYNPDYDTILVLKGNVTLQNYSPSFKSNILVTKPNLGNTINLNDYIYLGFMQFTKYLSNLNKHSNISIELENKVKSLLQFKANLQSCGNDDLYGLVSSLTYNTLIPTELLEELSIDTSNKIVIKHSDGTINLVDGDFDKRILYGYIPDLGGKMLQLDVSNYIIDNEGFIVIDTEKYEYEYINTYISHRELTLSSSQIETDWVNLTSSLTFLNKVYINGLLRDRYITLNFKNGIITSYDYLNTDYLYIIAQPNLDISYTIEIDNNNISTEELTTLDINMSIKEKALKLQLLLLSQMDDKPTNYEKLLIDNPDATITVPIPGANSGLDNPIQPIVDDGVDTDIFSRTPVNELQVESLLYMNDRKSHYPNQVYSLDISKFKTQVDETAGAQSVLYRIDLNWINCVNKKLLDTSNLPTFIHVNKTTNYASIVDHKYTVKELYQNARLKGSSITINDLEYEPSITGHRLFLNGDLYKYDAGDYNGKVYYRNMEDEESWKYLDTKDLNYLNMYTGPCYTIDNL